jgi:putative endonuclease
MDKTYYVCLLANYSNTTLYTGITSDLVRRIYEHKNKIIPGFTSKYNVNKLVYFEETSDVNAALEREKQIKGWLRIKKNQLVESKNKEWRDLSEGWF